MKAKGKAKKWNKSNRKHILGVIVIGVAIMIVVYTLSLTNRSVENIPIAYINDYPISFEEYELQSKKHKANVYSYFVQKYSIDNEEGFWDTSFGGEVPSDVLKKWTFDGIKRMKMEQILAKEMGLIDDISYQTFVDSFYAENERRLEAIDNDEIIYGPKQYTLSVYSDYVHSNLVAELMNALEKDELSLTEDDMKSYYEAHLDLFKIEDYIKVDILTVKALQGMEEEAEDKRLAIDKKLENGESFYMIVDEYHNDAIIDVSVEERLFDDSIGNTRETKAITLYMEADKLAIGTTSESIKINDEWHYVRVLTKEEMGYYTYDHVKEYIRSFLLKNKYDTLINALLEEASIVKNDF